MTKEELIWLAGFVDGEGYIGVVSKGNRYQAQLRIATTHFQTMSYVANLLGTKLGVRNSEHPIWKDCYYVVLYDKKAEELLKQLLPYLHTKKEQTQNVLDYRKTIVIGRNQHTSSLNVKVRQTQESFYKKSKLLNRKGKSNG